MVPGIGLEKFETAQMLVYEECVGDIVVQMPD